MMMAHRGVELVAGLGVQGLVGTFDGPDSVLEALHCCSLQPTFMTHVGFCDLQFGLGTCDGHKAEWPMVNGQWPMVNVGKARTIPIRYKISLPRNISRVVHLL